MIERSSLAAFFGPELHRGPTRDHHWIVTSRLAIVVLALAACGKDDGGAATGSGSAGSAAMAGSAAAKKGGGFSASLQAELAKEGSGSAAGSAAVAVAGSAAAPAPAAGSATVTAPASGSAAAPAAGSAAAKGSAVAVVDTKPAATTPAETKPAATTPPPATTVERPSAARVPVKPSADQAAIKMDLEPNWDRDVGEAGTISFVLKVPNSEDTRLFSFHYGYDPATAPADRDAYMKWLGDQKILNVTLNRQRGAAWYLEGTDGNGAPAFRTRITYGGKQLICYGSLYKDGASNQLGDLRDKVVMAAKKICETLTL
jgi:hypothetical protein